VPGAGPSWHWTKPATTADWADDVAAGALELDSRHCPDLRCIRFYHIYSAAAAAADDDDDAVAGDDDAAAVAAPWPAVDCPS